MFRFGDMVSGVSFQHLNARASSAVMIVCLFIFSDCYTILLTKLRKPERKKLGGAGKVVAEGESLKLVSEFEVR